MWAQALLEPSLTSTAKGSKTAISYDKNNWQCHLSILLSNLRLCCITVGHNHLTAL